MDTHEVRSQDMQIIRLVAVINGLHDVVSQLLTTNRAMAALIAEVHNRTSPEKSSGVLESEQLNTTATQQMNQVAAGLTELAGQASAPTNQP